MGTRNGKNKALFVNYRVIMEKITNPAVILAGVRKCGTTTLFDMLAAHSRICPASVKESQYFACDEVTIKKNLTWYEDLFNGNNDCVLLDGSTWYFGASNAPELINQCLPRSRIILSLRDPAARVFSAYLHMKKQTPSKEGRTFEEIITSMEDRILVAGNLFDAEDSLIDEANQTGLVDADYIDAGYHKTRFRAPFNTCLSDKRYEFRYFGESSYSRWLPSWKRAFGDRLHVIYFEDLMTQPELVIKDALEFTELEYESQTASLVKKNETRLPRGKLANIVLSYRANTAIGKFAASMLKSVGLKKLGAEFKSNFLYKGKESSTEEQMQRVRALLTDEYDYWTKQDMRTTELWNR